MNSINYQKELDKIIDKLEREEVIPRLLLHSCCAPCSSYVLSYLSKYFFITVLFYNPNISPREEFERRLMEQKRLIASLDTIHPIDIEESDYLPETFYEIAKGHETELEGNERCTKCYRLRLEETAKYAKRGVYDFFTTTLSISPLKSSQKLNTIGLELAEQYQVPYLVSDFKKKGGYQKSVELSKDFELYRQNFCGCIYSKFEAEQRIK